MKAPTFTDAQIAAAVKVAQNLPAKGNNPAKLPPPWPRPDTMPTVADVDFRDIKVRSVQIAKLQASNKSVKRPKLVWHLKHPGQTTNPSPFTQYPMVLDSDDDGLVIVDGHHRLYAFQLLGCTSAQCWLLPSK